MPEGAAQPCHAKSHCRKDRTWAHAHLWAALALRGDKHPIRARAYAAAAFMLDPELQQHREAVHAFSNVRAATYVASQPDPGGGRSLLDQVCCRHAPLKSARLHIHIDLPKMVAGPHRHDHVTCGMQAPMLLLT